MDNNDFFILEIKSTTSTNDFVRGLASSLTPSNPFVIVRADYQTGGKGQIGNSWESEDGKNLLFSVLYRPKNIKVKSQFYLSMAIALSIKDVVSLYVKGVQIKWPNDIYWRNKKLCGILVENDLTGKNIDACIMGAGLNVNQMKFESNAPNPISIAKIIGAEIPVMEILELVVIKLRRYIKYIEDGEFRVIEDNYMRSLFRGVGYYEYEDANGSFVAKVNHIEPTGMLVLTDSNGRDRRYEFKEVKYVFRDDGIN